MDETRSIKFNRREVDANPMRIFESRVTDLTQSVIAFAYCTRDDGSPNIIGTGFSVANLDDAGLFATCFHVVEEMHNLKKISKNKDLRKDGLIDCEKRVAYLKDERYVLEKIDFIRFIYDVPPNDPIPQLFRHDLTICYIPKIKLKPVTLSEDEYFIGMDLGILGFPNFGYLQSISVQPYALRTILSGRTRYKFNRSGLELPSDRLALGCIIGAGYSGSPVFSVTDGKVIGMVDYMPIEEEAAYVKVSLGRPHKNSKNEKADINILDGTVYGIPLPAGISLAVPSYMIEKAKNIALKFDWNNPKEQEIKVYAHPSDS